MSGATRELLPAPEIEAFLDDHGLGTGPLRARRIGEGASNLTFLVEREGARVVLRRPPPPPLPPSAHDMLREARIQRGLAATDVPVPEILAVCEDEERIGVPFYVMAELPGEVVTDALPPALDTPEERARLGEALVDALARLHAVPWREAGLEGIGRPDGYLGRQLRRWAGLWEVNATRELPLFGEVHAALEAAVPESPPAAVVHGDYRLGNVMVASDAPARIVGVLDWEMATLGDPLADLGYLVACWSEPGAPEHPMLMGRVTERPGFPDRAALAARYAERTGLSVDALPFYAALALWKAAVFCEAIHGRHLAGERDDAWAADLDAGVPRLLELARDLLRSA